MRIALVYKRLSDHGGSERQVLMHARELVARGHAVTIVCSQKRCEAPDGVDVAVMPWRAPGKLAQMHAFSSWATRRCRALGPFDITHGFGRTLGQSVYRIGGGCHRTYLDHAHALDKPPWQRRLLASTPFQRGKALLEQRMLSAPTTRAIITNSAMTRDDFIFRDGLDPALFHVVRNGVDLQRFVPFDDVQRGAARETLGLTAEDPVIAFIGTGYGRKGLEPLLRALPATLVDHPAAQLIVAGRDGSMAHWRSLAEALGVASCVHWLGGRSDPEVIAALADVTALPTAYDPAANATLESLAAGTPHVTSTMNGAAEIVDEGVHGSVVTAPVHPDDVAAALSGWLARRHERGAIAAATRQRAELHPIEHSCVRMLEVYRAVLDVDATERASATTASPGPTS